LNLTVAESIVTAVVWPAAAPTTSRLLLAQGN